jgi:hypothetical protein
MQDVFYVTIEQLKVNNYAVAPDGTVYAIKSWTYKEVSNHWALTEIELLQCIKDIKCAQEPKYFKGTWFDPFLKDLKFLKYYPENSNKS